MQYPYNGKIVEKGDFCLLVYRANKFGDLTKSNDDLKAKGEWLYSSDPDGVVLIPCHIEDIRDGYLVIRFYKSVNGKWEILHINDDKNLCLEIRNDDFETFRLIPYNWNENIPNREMI